jgi:esterase/lipase
LIRAIEEKGYEVVTINPDWYKPITEQIFEIEKDSIISGFSMGAVIAYLVAKKTPCKKVIFASISPVHTFKYKEFVDFLSTKMDSKLAIPITKDILNIKIDLKSLKCPYITLAGEKEGDKADILVTRTGHNMSDTYIKCINQLL